MERIEELAAQGQVLWLDFIHRRLIESGELARWVAAKGIRGVTSNPAIFEQAISSGDSYDAQLRDELARDPQQSVASLYETLAVTDVQTAADVLRPVWDGSGGADGYVSLEVSPHLADNTEGTLAEARRLWQRVDRPNLMIKVPATPAGVPAVETLLAEGIPVNITLMFSLGHYEAIAGAYLRGLERSGRPEWVASVASFFVSRIDSLLDPRLAEEPGLAPWVGEVGIANCRLAHARYREIFGGAAFAAWRERGCRPQRLLWASTSTKDPSRSDVLYVEELIGPETVNTVPPATLEAFLDHGTVAPRLLAEGDRARAARDALAAAGIDLDVVGDELQRQGVAKFVEPFERLLEALERRRGELLAASPA